MGELLAFRAQLAATHRNPAFDVAVPTLNLGCLRAGDNPNRICDHADLQIDLRLLPGMDTAGDHRRARAAPRAIRRSARHDDSHEHRCRRRCHRSPHPATANWCAPWSACREQRAGTVAFSTEGPFLQALGMETVIFGPGSIDQAHQPDEYLALDRIAAGRRRADAADRRSLRALRLRRVQRPHSMPL